MEIDDALLAQQLQALQSEIETLERQILTLTIRRDTLRDLVEGRMTLAATPALTPPEPTPIPIQLEPAPTPIPIEPAPAPTPSTVQLRHNHKPRNPGNAQKGTGVHDRVWVVLAPFIGDDTVSTDDCFARLTDSAHGAGIRNKQQMYVSVTLLRERGWMCRPAAAPTGYYRLTDEGKKQMVKAAIAKSTNTKATNTKAKATKAKAKRGPLSPQDQALLRFIALTRKPGMVECMDHMDSIGKSYRSRDHMSAHIHKCRNHPWRLIKQTDEVRGTHYELTEEGMATFGPSKDDELPPKQVTTLPRVVDPQPGNTMANALSEAQQAVVDVDTRREQIENFNKGSFRQKRRRTGMGRH